jgi:hypothetical protein
MYCRDSNGSIIAERFGEVGLLAILNVLQTPPRRDVIKIEHCKVRSSTLFSFQFTLINV